MNQRLVFRGVIGMSLLLVSLAVPASMLISPTRAVLDEDTQTVDLTLRNTGDGPRTYRVDWVQRRMNEQGRYRDVGDAEDWPAASELIRHSPRQITVGAEENQTVRLRYRPPEDLEPGEYRSHLRLEVLPDVSEPDAVFGGEGGDDGGLGFELKMAMSFTIPVIVRHEVSAPEVSLRNIEVLEGEEEGEDPALSMVLERQGEASAFGNLVVEMQADEQSPVQRIGERSDLAVFHEMDRREVTVRLRDAQIPVGAYVRVAYEGKHEYRNRVWDERVFQVE